MGIDLIIDIAMFYVIWRFFWKKSRNKHMAAAGRCSTLDLFYFIVFVVAFIASMIVPLTIVGMGLFTPFVVLGSIIVSYFVTTRLTLGVPRIGSRRVLQKAQDRVRRIGTGD